MQNVGERVTSGTALTSIGSEFLGVNLTSYEWGNLTVAVLMGIGWFYFKWQDLQMKKDKIAWDRQTERRDQKKPRD